MVIRTGVLTLSDKGSRGERVDTSGPAIIKMLEEAGNDQGEYEIAWREIIPDDKEQISATLQQWSEALDLVLTTGGTGMGQRDNTPEATLAVIDRQAPGIAEAIRAASLLKTPYAMLSRGVAGTLGSCLIVNLPGSERAARECLQVILPVLPHAVGLMQGNTEH